MERLRASRSLPFVVVQKTFMTSDNDRELAAFCHRQAHQEPPGATNGSRAILPAPPPNSGGSGSAHEDRATLPPRRRLCFRARLFTLSPSHAGSRAAYHRVAR